MLLFLLLLLLPRCSSVSERGSHHPSGGPKHLVPEMTIEGRALLSPRATAIDVAAATPILPRRLLQSFVGSLVLATFAA